jgi:cyclophilin family peptidyl-prolyl cis-trans isomerase
VIAQKCYKKERVVFELFSENVPATVKNFVSICKGDKGVKRLNYKGNKIFKVIRGFMMQGGDTVCDDGTGGCSIYGPTYNDEGLWIPHTHKGIISSANSGPDTNASQFFVSLGKCSEHDGKYTAFGRVIHGMDIITSVESMETKGISNDTPVVDVKIANCGELVGKDKLKANKCDFLHTYSVKEQD